MSIDAAAIAAAVGCRAGICISPEPTPIRSVRSASTDSTETTSCPHASDTHTQSMPASSAAVARAICSSKEYQGQ